MSETISDQDALNQNQQGLAELIWAMEMSQGQFKLMLVRCNYGTLRDSLVQQLRKQCPLRIREIVLEPTVQQVYSTLRERLGDEIPDALMVFGLESAAALDVVLTSLNQVREEFRKNCPFPVIFWINDEVSIQLTRLAPDFESWASLTEFAIAPGDLVTALQEESDRLFTEIFAAGNQRFVTNQEIFGKRYPFEMTLALQDLEKAGQQLSPKLVATLPFVWGREAYTGDRMDEALNFYQQSLLLWQDLDEEGSQECAGAVFYHIGLCYARRAKLGRTQSDQWLKLAQSAFQAALDSFEAAGRTDLVAQFIGQLGETLRQLNDYSSLQELAQSAIKLHKTSGNPVFLARDYGFLAEVALTEQKWDQGKELAEQALEILATDPQRQQRQGLYLLLLARSLRKLGDNRQAIARLEEAAKGDPQDNPHLYIEILEELRSLYYQQEQYVKAFDRKQERLSIEQQFGLRAFIGAGRLEPQRQARSQLMPTESLPRVAGEILASGRQQDVERLIQRIGTTQYKLTVIHGPSGVGKSSLVQAGLLPALRQRVMGDRDVLAVSQRLYTDWVKTLGELLAEALAQREIPLEGGFESLDRVLEQLRQNEPNHLLTVLIFDQFEEFFFVCKEPEKRQKFFDFLASCFQIPFVKVVLSLREDYIHYLLAYNSQAGFEVIDSDILSKHTLYAVGNFPPADAVDMIRSLSDRAHFPLEAGLIEVVVTDLADKLKAVRPIELQIVGAQLQTDDITTLAAYRTVGPNPKEQLVHRYLEEVVKDCGPKNQKLAELILYLLTDENNTRPLKTRVDLETDLKVLTIDWLDEPDRLNLILYVFVKSGLVFMLPELPANRYQLVHDYLVSFVRRKNEKSIVELKEALIKAQSEKEKSDRQLNLVLKRQLKATFGAGIVLAILAGGAVGLAVQSRQLAADLKIQQDKSEKANQELKAKNNQAIENEKQLNELTKQLQEEKKTVLDFARNPDPESVKRVLGSLIRDSQTIGDYTILQDHLAKREWEKADRETSELLLWIAGPESEMQGYFNPDEYQQFPCQALTLIDDLWVAASGRTLGLSVQNRIYQETGKNWQKMYDRVGWKKDSKWLVDQQFNQSEKRWFYVDSAQPNFENPPLGHLPIFNGIAVFETPPMKDKVRQRQIQELLSRCWPENQ